MCLNIFCFLCILLLFIYLLSIASAILSIAICAIDLHINSEFQNNNTVHTNQTMATTTTTYTSTTNNIILAVLMLCSAIPGIYHYFSPRLIFIALMVLFSAICLICRAFMAAQFHLRMMSTVILDAILGCIFFYVGAFLLERETDESNWNTFTKKHSGAGSSMSGSSALPSSAPGTSALGPQSTAHNKSSKVPKSAKKKKKKKRSRSSKKPNSRAANSLAL